ncbi:Pre-mRNA-splicing factor syf2 [Cercospora beticola]|uniref:Pre-mRNA-splicing factor SYF2 n=1 Tax=Cercospora beticola TaxID=122368 RepID=A0A2G5HRB8_CERBT|nr:Pre-mRNA-splicing factor syf2 [Cercospora beticola]PIA95068.1 Pre-mRNA-splicing factor syf2 [Cercospora beticola]WPB05507.1 pre-mRNA-splicing factor syf2 [Cercospora beticola]
MPVTRKRKGSPALEEDAESSKRRFAEANVPDQQLESELKEDVAEAAAKDDTATTPAEAATAPSAADERAARFAALRARNAASRKSNLQETKQEMQRASVDPSQLTSINRKKDVASHKLLKAEIEESGEDFERKRAWDWTIEESERWDERLAEKARKRDENQFVDYNKEAGKVYERQLGQMAKAGFEERLASYEQDKREAINRAVASGGLELVETQDGELIAVDKDGTFYSTNDTSTFTNGKPSKDAVDRLVADIKKAEEVRMKKRRERGRPDEDGSDVTYINEKNKQFNMKLARFYNKYTADIRESFERGTAI